MNDEAAKEAIAAIAKTITGNGEKRGPVERRGIGLTLPRVNLNGTSKDDLMEQYHKAVEALQKAEDAMREAFPHGRDYQTMNPEAYQSARDQHQDRINMINVVLNEMNAIREGVYDQ